MSLFGLGRQKPHHYREMVKVAWENRDQLPFAWRILRDGVCDGCALGTSGMTDWTVPGPHLCMVRLELMRLNTSPALDVSALSHVGQLTTWSSERLRALGRIPEPMIRRPGEPGFRVITWDEALDRLAGELRSVDPNRLALYLTSRGITNEVYYAAQKAARFFGTNHVDNSARLCHAASTAAMKATLGYGASTCSYVDWLHADLIVLLGSNVANNQPVTMKYLYHAKKNGAQIAVVNPYREPGLERYWVPSVPESALGGTAMADHWFTVNTGGDLAFLVGVFRALLAFGGIDERFVRENTIGFDAARMKAESVEWSEIEQNSGAPRERIEACARLLIDRPNTVFVWSMGLTQHAHGVDTIKALVNVGLARGLPGRPNSGLVPIRGHSGVQGGAEVGCVPAMDPATAARWANVWGFAVPTMKGWTTAEMIDRSAAGDVDVFWIVGGNFLETIPDADAIPHGSVTTSASSPSGCRSLIRDARRRRGRRSAAAGRHALRESGRRHRDVDRAADHLLARDPWPPDRISQTRVVGVPRGDGSRRPERKHLVGLADAAAIRDEISRAIPLYQGIERLKAKGDQMQWGGRMLYTDGRFATPDGKAHFAAVTPRPAAADADRFAVSTRRGKQFNSMVQREIDPLTGASRDDILISRDDLERLHLAEGAAVRLRSASGTFRGKLRSAPIKPGNLEVHWPEGNALLSSDAIDPDSMEPDFNARVTIETAV